MKLNTILSILFLLFSNSLAERFNGNVDTTYICEYDVTDKTYTKNCATDPKPFKVIIDVSDTLLTLNGVEYLVESTKTDVNADNNEVLVLNTKKDNKDVIVIFAPTYLNVVFVDSLKLSAQYVSDEPNYYTGSAFGINKHTIITNHHVIEYAKNIILKLNADSYATAKVLYSDKGIDIAILSVDSSVNACSINDANIDIGTDVTAYGYPQIMKQGVSMKVTKGIISSRFGFLDDIKTYQIDAAIQSGNSGGPLVSNNKVVGVVVSTLNESQTVNYAIKSTFLVSMLKSVGIKNEGNSHPNKCTYLIVGTDK